MSKIKQLIESAVEKKPLDIKEMVDDIMREKVKEIVTESVYEFEYEDDDLNEDDDIETFFEEFHAEYGHLSLEEQKDIMEELISESDEELSEQEEFFAAFYDEYGHLSEDEQAEIMAEILDEAEYDEDAVNKQIAREKIGKGEASKIHALLKGRKPKKTKDGSSNNE